MISKYSLLLVLLAFSLVGAATSTVSSFEQLAKTHCHHFPLELIYRLSTGQLAEIYGPHFADLDCYIRQFVNKDGQDTFSEDEDEEDEDEEQSNEQQQEDIPENDPLVIEYAKGLDQCLPEGTDPVEAVYAIWRFYRFVLQHDYTLEWMRAKIRASLGYEAERPSAWMDGQLSAARLRLDKLFSNQFYDYVDKLMFRDFLHPIITFLKKNVVFAAASPITKSGRPILVQYIENKNLLPKVFLPVVLARSEGNLFSYTVPGVPLLLAGTTSKLSWAFTGILTDRSNIEQIQTLGNKFYHHGSETWIKLENITLEIKVKGEQPRECKFVHSNYGTLYEKHKSLDGGKVSQYIARWHQREDKVRVVFSDLYNLINSQGQTNTRLQFPFSSLVLTNSSGIYQYLCLQKHPSYFLYPDLAGAPEYGKERWVSNFKRNFLVVTNTHLTTKNQEAYLKKEIMNPTEEQFLIDTRRFLNKKDSKFTQESLLDYVLSLQTDPLIKKRKDHLIYIYRKAKFLFFPEDSIRKQCDQIVALLQRWDNNLNSRSISPAFILWDYFFREYTFNFVSSAPEGAAIAKHKAVTDNYWTAQMELWRVGTSYGECDSNEWNLEYKQKLNNTGDNSTCFFNIMRGINRTREVLRSDDGTIKEPLLADYSQKKIQDLVEGYLGTHVEEAFGQFYSKQIAFAAELDNSQVIFLQGYEENRNIVDLDAPRQKVDQRGQLNPKSAESEDEQL